MKKYFEVMAKCGHVGKEYYYLGAFYECAESKKQAAEIVRNRPRVKHHHKDAIMSVTEITREEFEAGIERKRTEAYYACTNVQEQRSAWDSISAFVYEEPRYAEKKDFSKAERMENRRERIRFAQAKQKSNLRFTLQSMAEAYAY